MEILMESLWKSAKTDINSTEILATGAAMPELDSSPASLMELWTLDDGPIDLHIYRYINKYIDKYIEKYIETIYKCLDRYLMIFTLSLYFFFHILSIYHHIYIYPSIFLYHVAHVHTRCIKHDHLVLVHP